MSTSPGGRLGPFSVERELGRGGMGIVYLARDPRLNRRVAIKVLPPAVAGDSASLGRFRREATLLAALNHPNIAAIHSVEDAGGQQLLVLEYVPGPTLADVMADPSHTSNGRLPLAQALAIATQIASALEAAHEQGIVHRDLKPANIKVRDDGTVKVLDFGLAKSLAGADDEDAQAGHDSESLTMRTMTSPAMTQMGVILGTAGYMSPEQARGKTVDKRADLWAFGVVLYEMLTGERLFQGETVTDVIASVVTREPAWESLPAETPAPIRRLLRRCLQKEPRRRLRDASDARFEIEDALSGADEPAASIAPSAPRAAQFRRSRWMIAAAAIGAAAIAGVLGYAFGSARPESPTSLRQMSVMLLGRPITEALSPDGAWLVGRHNNRLHVRAIDQTEWRELPGTDGVHYSFFWSPDSRQIGFAAGAALMKVGVDGSRAQTICDGCLVPNLLRGGSWSPNGTIILGGTGGGGAWPGGIKTVSATGQLSDVTKLNRARGENSHRSPAFLPDGRRFLFAVRRDNGEHEIQLASIDGDEPRVVTPAFSRMAYADGYLLFARGQTLLAQPFDPATGTLSGTPATIATNVRHTVAVGEAFFSVATDGTLVYASALAIDGAVWVERDGRRVATALTDVIDETLRLSPDGRTIAAAIHDLDKASTDIILIDVASGARSRLTSHSMWEQNPVWSPDGKQIGYRGARDGIGIYIQDAAGGNERLLAADAGQMLRPVDWSRDGRILATCVTTSGIDLVLVPVTGGPVVPFAKTTAADGVARFSPDGKLVTYESRESGSDQIHIKAVDSSSHVRVTKSGGSNPVWSRNGQELFYVDNDHWIVAVPMSVTGERLNFGPPKRLFPRGEAGVTTAAFDVDASGRFLMRPYDDDSRAGDRTILNVVQNWTKLIGVNTR